MNSNKAFLGIGKLGALIIIMIAVIIILVTNDLSFFAQSTIYESTKKSCEFNEDTIIGDDSPECNPRNCDELNCSEDEQARWNNLKTGFKESKCFDNVDNCNTSFEEKMHQMVVEGETGERVEDDVRGQIDFNPSEDRYAETVPSDLVVEVDSNYRNKYENKLSEEFILKVEEIASELGTNPEYLLAVIDFETGGTFDPSQKNRAGSGATGLIQFMPQTAEELGTTTDELSSMSRLEQLDYVARYFSSFNVEYDSLEDVYMAVLFPRALGKGLDYVMFQEGTTVYSQNSGLDIDDNGEIIVAEAVHKVGTHYRSS